VVHRSGEGHPGLPAAIELNPCYPVDEQIVADNVVSPSTHEDPSPCILEDVPFDKSTTGKIIQVHANHYVRWVGTEIVYKIVSNPITALSPILAQADSTDVVKLLTDATDFVAIHNMFIPLEGNPFPSAVLYHISYDLMANSIERDSGPSRQNVAIEVMDAAFGDLMATFGQRVAVPSFDPTPPLPRMTDFTPEQLMPIPVVDVNAPVAVISDGTIFQAYMCSAGDLRATYSRYFDRQVFQRYVGHSVERNGGLERRDDDWIETIFLVRPDIQDVGRVVQVPFPRFIEQFQCILAVESLPVRPRRRDGFP